MSSTATLSAVARHLDPVLTSNCRLAAPGRFVAKHGAAKSGVNEQLEAATLDLSLRQNQPPRKERFRARIEMMTGLMHSHLSQGASRLCQLIADRTVTGGDAVSCHGSKAKGRVPLVPIQSG